MNDTIRELLRAAFTAGENSYLSDDPLTCEDWIETREVHEALESMQEVGLRVVEEHKARGDVLVTLTQRAVALGYDDAADALDYLEAAAAYREPPSREGKVKVVVRIVVTSAGNQGAWVEGEDIRPEDYIEEDGETYLLSRVGVWAGEPVPVQDLGDVSAVEVVEDVEVVDG